MGKTLIEKILARHAGVDQVKPGEILDVEIDVRVARDFGGASVVKHIRDHDLGIDDPQKTFFTFDCNPTGSDQHYAANQQLCRQFAKEHGIKVYDINRGIGTHLMIEEGLAYPGSTAVSTDSHANILGAIGAFGQGMGDKDIAAAWSRGQIWFRVPESVRLLFKGELPEDLTAKDIVLNLLSRFGASTFLGKSIELEGETVETLTLDQRITLASMATELGAVTLLIPPSQEVIRYCESRICRRIDAVYSDPDARYAEEIILEVDRFVPMVSRPGKPHDAVSLDEVRGTSIDSAFIGSCTNGRMEDLHEVAEVLKDRKVADGVVLKIVPCTDRIWNLCLEEGLLEIFKDARALVSNPGCAGCAAGQVGQNGPGEVTISSGNRNFPGKQGMGEVYLASPQIVAASAVAGFITSVDMIPGGEVLDDWPDDYDPGGEVMMEKEPLKKVRQRADATQPVEFEGRVWVLDQDDIDTDMIYHNRHLAVTDPREMGQYALGNLKGFENFAKAAKPGDILLAGKNFGAGSSRQQAVDCFKAIGIACIIAESFAPIYERNAINAALPILRVEELRQTELKSGDTIAVNLKSGEITLPGNQQKIQAAPFSEVQMEIYQNGGLF